MESTEAIDLDFHKLWLIVKRRWLPAAGVFSCVVAIATVLAQLQKPVYEAQGKLLFKKIDQTSSLLTEVGQEIGQLDSLAAKSNPVNTEIEIIRSVPFLEKTVTALDLKNEEGASLNPRALAADLTLKNIPLTDVLQVSYESTNPEEAAAVVNKLMLLYIENNVLTNRAEAAAAGDFIAKQLPKTEATVREAEMALRKFKEQYQVVSLEEEAKSAVAFIRELETDFTETQAELADANARSANLQSKIAMNSQEAIDLSSLNQSAGVQKALEEFQAIEAQLALEQSRFVDSHPLIVELKSKRDGLQALLQERIGQSVTKQGQSNQNLQMGNLKQSLIEEFVRSEVERLGLASRMTSLSNAQSIYKQRANILPQLEQQQRELDRRLEAAQSTYEILLKKLQEVRVAENQNMGNARIIETAEVPVKASARKKLLILALGNVLGIILAIVTIIILEVSDTSIKNLREARELFGYTLLGSIPYFGKKLNTRRKNQESPIPELPVRDTPRLPISEAYRMLQANLKFLSSDKALKVIVVTSSVPKEGKSTVSANLAAAMAQLGRRVLLVDADMRHPMQHHIWELTNAAGLSDVIVGQAEFEAVVCEVMPKLDVLTAGVMPPNPMALLDSKRMASLISDFSETYDFVIIDAPPLVIGADALTLGKMTDGVLLVARPGVLTSTSAAAAKESLECSCQNVLGLVVNGVNLEKESDSYFYYAKEYSLEEHSTTRKQAVSATGKHGG